ncbi:MAG: pilus assembly protein TadG-related protein [Acidimicrobiales bacterium]
MTTRVRTRSHASGGQKRRGMSQGGEDGYVTIWMLLWTPVLIAGLVAIVDYGAAIQARALASDVAVGAARAGAAQVVSVAGAGPQIDPDPALANAAGYVAEADARAPERMGLTAAYQIEPDTVTVTVTVTYDPWLLDTMTNTFTRTEQAQMQVGR